MPQACTRMRTCPAPAFGISRSTISKSAPGFGTCATFIFAIETLRSFILDLQPQVGCTVHTIGHIFSAAELADRSKNLCGESQKVLQRFPRRCTGRPIDVYTSSTHNPRNSLNRESVESHKKES